MKTMRRLRRRALGAAAICLTLVTVPAIAQVSLFATKAAAFNGGDVEGVLATFHDDAVVTGGAACPATNPCAGREQLRKRWVEPIIANKVKLRVLAIEGSAEQPRAREEVSMESWRQLGIERAVMINEGRVENGRFKTMQLVMDTSDAQTAQLVQTLRARASAPAATPAVAATPTRDSVLAELQRARAAGELDHAYAELNGPLPYAR